MQNGYLVYRSLLVLTLRFRVPITKFFEFRHWFYLDGSQKFQMMACGGFQYGSFFRLKILCRGNQGPIVLDLEFLDLVAGLKFCHNRLEPKCRYRRGALKMGLDTGVRSLDLSK